MMDGYGYMDGGGWLGMTLAVLLWTGLVVALAVWAARSFRPPAGRAGGLGSAEAVGHGARIAELEGDVRRLREEVALAHRDGAESR